MKKIAMMLTSIALVAAVAVGGTLAYLTATSDTVTNTFTVGAGISITLDESALKADGTKDTGATRVTQNTYTMAPGSTVPKDPTVHVTAASPNCWVYVCVEDELNAAVQGSATYTVDATKWETVGTPQNGKTIYKYKTMVAADAQNKDLVVFDGVTFSETLNDTTLNQLKNKTIKISAYAHQADNLSDGFDMDQAATAHFTE